MNVTSRKLEKLEALKERNKTTQGIKQNIQKEIRRLETELQETKRDWKKSIYESVEHIADSNLGNKISEINKTLEECNSALHEIQVNPYEDIAPLVPPAIEELEAYKKEIHEKAKEISSKTDDLIKSFNEDMKQLYRDYSDLSSEMEQKKAELLREASGMITAEQEKKIKAGGINPNYGGFKLINHQRTKLTHMHQH